MPENIGKPVDIVITAPEELGTALAYSTHCRTTIGVLMQLVTQARDRVLIAAPFIQVDYGKPAELLQGALSLAVERGVKIEIISTDLSPGNVEKLCSKPTAKGLVHILKPHPKLTDGKHLGLHAKFCVVDGMSAYVGSANLTGPGLTRHLEMGVLVHGETAKQIEAFWRHCIELDLIVNEEPRTQD